MKTKLTTLILLLLLTATANAQNPRAILDKASDAYTKAGSLIAGFTLDSKDTKTNTTHSYDGKAYMKGNKFKIDIPDGITWFDGKTQWVYIKDIEEVNVSNPTNEELQGVSPIAIFSVYKSGFNLVYKGEVKSGVKTLLVVEMTPQKSNTDITKVTVSIDKATNIFSKIVVDNKANQQTTLTVKNYQITPVTDATFVFNKKDYPRSEIVDLR